MRLLFSSDMHGNDEQYEKLFNFATKEQVDVVIIGGDIAPKHIPADRYVAVQREWYERLGEHLGRFRQLHPEAEVLVMMGNDDAQCNLQTLLTILERFGAKYLHLNRYTIGDVDITGYTCVPITPFSLKDWEMRDISYMSDYSVSLQAKLAQPITFEGYISSESGWVPVRISTGGGSIQDDLMQPVFTDKPHKTVYVLHSPPALTKLDMIWNGMHVGSIAIREFIENHKPLLTLHGHIHETVRLSGDYREQIGSTWSYACGNHETTHEIAMILIDTDAPQEGKRIIF
jgi:uncharacterized protein